jgi:elongation factor P
MPVSRPGVRAWSRAGDGDSERVGQPERGRERAAGAEQLAGAGIAQRSVMRDPGSRRRPSSSARCSVPSLADVPRIAAGGPRAGPAPAAREARRAMEYSTSDFRRGLRVELDGEPYVIIESEFMKPGKGQAVYRIKCKGLLRDRVLDMTYRSGDKVTAADVMERSLEYSYKAGSNYVFMDMETYDQHEVHADALGDAVNYLLEGMTVDVVFWNGQVISVTPPRHVDLTVEYCEPAAKGNTATSVQKPAKMETGCEVQVPAFINIGDVLKVDTRTGAYVERVSKA